MKTIEPSGQQAEKTNSEKVRTRPDKYLRRHEVSLLTKMGKSAIYEGMRNRTFPLNVRVAPRTVVWIERDIVAWQQERLKKSRGEA
ncbi:MAG: AlpA family phage regulatory protein [Hydrogenophaga sp.]|uniref:helix-turn-helix transcriptional regulator n=1 Tax=Hydrogenophaga sp. TaxID=1904254 RepID=UPI00271CBD6C|nr:AlpA family phage regulatory protein [Hydrogenophaga sp.]MDO9032878.1 AlpA family phage regulatory protein [Hydrogenophaga sp.]